MLNSVTEGVGAPLSAEGRQQCDDQNENQQPQEHVPIKHKGSLASPTGPTPETLEAGGTLPHCVGGGCDKRPRPASSVFASGDLTAFRCRDLTRSCHKKKAG